MFVSSDLSEQPLVVKGTHKYEAVDFSLDFKAWVHANIEK